MKNLPAVLGLPWYDMVTSGSFDFARSSICSVRAYSVRKWLCYFIKGQHLCSHVNQNPIQYNVALSDNPLLK